MDRPNEWTNEWREYVYMGFDQCCKVEFAWYFLISYSLKLKMMMMLIFVQRFEWKTSQIQAFGRMAWYFDNNSNNKMYSVKTDIARRWTFVVDVALAVFKYAILLFFIRLMISFRQSSCALLTMRCHSVLLHITTSAASAASAASASATQPALANNSWMNVPVCSHRVNFVTETETETEIEWENAESLLANVAVRNDDGLYAYKRYNTFISPLLHVVRLQLHPLMLSTRIYCFALLLHRH